MWAARLNARLAGKLLKKRFNEAFNLRSDFKCFLLCGSNMATKSSVTLETLHFDNLALRSLPVEENSENYPRTVSGACFSRVPLQPLEKPVMVAWSDDVAQLLGLSLGQQQTELLEAAQYLSGSKLIPGSEPAAHCYCGHQFGYFAGQLGDGAAMYLGEVVNDKNERWEVQLKGAGLTPYSRTADGRKVLRSSIREFLCSEAMFYLGIPTTRALSCVTSDTKIIRDIFYDGHPVLEKCSVVCRVAQTFIRFGSFEIFKTLEQMTGRVGPSVGRVDILKQMLDYLILTFYEEIYNRHRSDEKLDAMYEEFYQEVIKRTAHLVASWQCFGFCHGVLNTDNMSIVGLTIDYGPFGFMDYFNPEYVCNASDDGGRYSYINQPNICEWNLHKLAEALQPVLPLQISRNLLEKTFSNEFNLRYLHIMRNKLGLMKKQLPEDRNLITDFLKTLEVTGADFTSSFRILSKISLPGCSDFHTSINETKSALLNFCCYSDDLKTMHRPTMTDSHFRIYVALLSQHPELLEQLGKGAEAIKREIERREKFEQITNLTDDEKRVQDEKSWSEWLSKYSDRLSLEVEEENDAEELNLRRVKTMNSTNPKFILRNYIAQVAIEAAENGDFSEVNKLLQILKTPYEENVTIALHEKQLPTRMADLSVQHESGEDASAELRSVKCYDAPPPSWARALRVT